MATLKTKLEADYRPKFEELLKDKAFQSFLEALGYRHGYLYNYAFYPRQHQSDAVHRLDFLKPNMGSPSTGVAIMYIEGIGTFSISDNSPDRINIHFPMEDSIGMSAPLASSTVAMLGEITYYLVNSKAGPNIPWAPHQIYP